MSRAPRHSAASVNGAAPSQRRSLVWLQGLLCGALATLATPIAVLLAALLGPGLLALVLDRLPGKPIARAMLLFGLAASVGPVRQVWLAGMTMPATFDQLAEPLVIGAAWAAASVGWLLAELAPVVARLAFEAHGATRAASLRATRRRHEGEWGLAPTDEDAAN